MAQNIWVSMAKHLCSHCHQQTRAPFSCLDTSTRGHLRSPKCTPLTSGWPPEQHESRGPWVSSASLWAVSVTLCFFLVSWHLKCLILGVSGWMNPSQYTREPGEQMGRVKWIYWQSYDTGGDGTHLSDSSSSDQSKYHPRKPHLLSPPLPLAIPECYFLL